MSNPPSFYLAGTMQGSNPGVATVDQGYRPRLEGAIRATYPEARIHCPHRLLLERFGARQAEIARSYSALGPDQWAFASRYDPQVLEITSAFHDLVRLAGEADVLVAYLPGHQASMGTAIEMWSAHASGKNVIAITAMAQNLAVASTSSVIVPTIEAFGELLRSGFLEGRDTGDRP